MKETELIMSRRQSARTLRIRNYMTGSDQETTDPRRKLLRRIELRGNPTHSRRLMR